MNPNLPSPTVHTLELLVRQHRGQDVDYAWQWPKTASQLNFADILAGLKGVDVAWLAQASACTLQRQGPDEQPAWVLGHGSPEMVCSVNQKWLAPGSQLRLEHGDEIELGSLRCVVSLAHSRGVVDAAAREPGLGVAPTRVGPVGNFARIDPATSALSKAQTAVMQQGLLASSVSDLMAFGAAAYAQYEQDVQQKLRTPGLDDLLALPQSIDSVLQGQMPESLERMARQDLPE